jgi:hypothetical protein
MSIENHIIQCVYIGFDSNQNAILRLYFSFQQINWPYSLLCPMNRINKPELKR